MTPASPQSVPSYRESVVVPVANLKAHPRNYRVHPQDQIQHLAESLREHGLYRNIVVARDFTILAGHGVVQAVKVVGLAEVPVVVLDLDPNDTRALKVLAGDNEVQHLVESDDRALTEILKQINDDDLSGLLGTGYDAQMLAALVLVTRSADEIADMDAASQWVGLPDYDEGPEPYRIVVGVADEADRDKVMALLQVHKRGGNKKTWSVVWPDRPQDDLAAVRFEAGAEA
jgi:ParB-like chromosome segregation protein Spo0J